MRRSASLRHLVACLLMLLLSSSGVALAEGKQHDKKSDAKLHYETGIRKFDLGRYDEAAQEFVDAYELVGEPAILYNIAQAYRLGERFEKSAQFYRSFLRHMGQVANRAEIEGRIAEMDERAADLKRKAERDAMDKADAERRASRQSGEHTSERPNLDDAPRQTQTASPGRGLKIGGYVLFGVSAGFVVMGGAMSGLAARASSKVEAAASMNGTFTTDLRDVEAKGKLYDKLAIVGYSLAGATAIGGALCVYFGFRQERFARFASDARPRKSARLAIPLFAPSVSPESVGLVMMGRF